MNAQSDTLRRAMEALDSVCTKSTAKTPPPAPSSLELRLPALPPEPLHDPEDWREPLTRWIAADCISHWRLHSSVGRLHVAFSEWEVAQGEVPCSRAIFESLLRQQGREIHPTLALVSGLMVRKELAISGYYPELLSRQSR
jgi:hypothetical protein